MTNFLANGPATTAGNDQGHERMMHGSVIQVSTNERVLSCGDS